MAEVPTTNTAEFSTLLAIEQRAGRHRRLRRYLLAMLAVAMLALVGAHRWRGSGKSPESTRRVSVGSIRPRPRGDERTARMAPTGAPERQREPGAFAQPSAKPLRPFIDEGPRRPAVRRDPAVSPAQFSAPVRANRGVERAADWPSGPNRGPARGSQAVYRPHGDQKKNGGVALTAMAQVADLPVNAPPVGGPAFGGPPVGPPESWPREPAATPAAAPPNAFSPLPGERGGRPMPMPPPPPVDEPVEPPVLRDRPAPRIEPQPAASVDFLMHPRDAPHGYTGPSGIAPLEVQTDAHYVPMEDRWRSGFPEWDRYQQGFPIGKDYPYKRGHWLDPYNQNLLKGDYPIIGQQTFFELEVFDEHIIEARQVPTGTTPFESTINSRQEEFFGNPNQFFYTQPLLVSFELFQGNAAFKPKDWRVRITPAFNVNHLDTEELAIVLPDVRRGTQRSRTDFTIEEWFVEAKLADIGPNYDFVSVRAGSQFFVSDFRGFLFNDVNRAVRLFGTRNSNREEFNVVWFDQTEKETNSQLNTFDDRHQNTLIVNYYLQDFIWPGYTSQLSFHYNRDEATTKFDRNNFLVRPDPVGVFRPHEINSYYLGWAGNGHINRLNIMHQMYLALGRDELNPIAGKPQDIEAYLAAVEFSIDRDWARFRASFMWASGDNDPSDGDANGFDSITENPNFAGGEFSFWQRQAIQLFGVRLVNDRSLLPDLRSSRVQGQTNFVNPGLLLANVGLDADLTPKMKLIANANYLWFDTTETLELFTFQGNLDRAIGADLSMGLEYRPFLNDNVEIIGGVSMLIPDKGFKQLYNPLRGEVDTLVAGFMEMIFIY